MYVKQAFAKPDYINPFSPCAEGDCDIGRFQNLAEPMRAAPQDQYSLLLNAVNGSRQGAEAQAPSHYTLQGQIVSNL